MNEKQHSTIIEFQNVTKSFYDGKLIANDNISFTVKRGTVHVIAGENGAGKSVLLSMLFGLYEPTNGTIIVNGEKVKFASAADAMHRGLGMVQQHFQLVDKFTVGQNILLGNEGIFMSTHQANKKLQHFFKKFAQKFSKSRNRRKTLLIEMHALEMIYRIHLLNTTIESPQAIKSASNTIMIEFRQTMLPFCENFQPVQFQKTYRELMTKFSQQKFGIVSPSRSSQIYGFNKFKDVFKKIDNLAKQYKFGINAHQKVSSLTVGQQQKTEILKLLFRDSEILIFDEPTAMLTPQETKELLQIILNLRNEGKTIIMITHKLDEISVVADEVSVIRRGQYIGLINAQELTPEKLSTMMVGREIEKISKKKQTFGKPVLTIEDLIVKERMLEKVKKISLHVRAGEILAIAGVEGNGQSHLANAIAGLIKPHHGKIKIYENDITKMSVKERHTLGIAYVPEDRHRYGLILDMKVHDNAVLKNFTTYPFAQFGIINRAEIQNFSNNLIEKFDVRGTESGQALMQSLSGGNQQKLVIGREISSNADLMIIFQATRGLDVGAIEFIHKQIVLAREQMRAILLISYDLNEVITLADRVIVMNGGRITGELIDEEISVKQIGILMSKGVV